MFSGVDPLPKYEEVVKDSATKDSVVGATLPQYPTTTVNANANVRNPASFHVNLVPSVTPVFGPNPIETDCPFCQAHIVTSIERISGALPWITMGICVLLGFFLLIPWCLCTVPFCMDNFQDVVHSCPVCKRNLGRFKRI